jgi:hypothetical protein
MNKLYILIILFSVLFSQSKKETYLDEAAHHIQVWNECGIFHSFEDPSDKKISRHYGGGRVRPLCTEDAKLKWDKELDAWIKVFYSYNYYSEKYGVSAFQQVPHNGIQSYQSIALLGPGLWYKRELHKKTYNFKIDIPNVAKKCNDLEWREKWKCYARYSKDNYEKLQLYTKYLSLLQKDISSLTSIWGPFSRVIDNGSSGKIYIWEKSKTKSYTTGDSKIRYNWIIDTYTVHNDTKKTRIETTTSYKHVYVGKKDIWGNEKIQKIDIGSDVN